MYRQTSGQRELTVVDPRPFTGRAVCPTCGPLRDISAVTERDLSLWIARAYDRHTKECGQRPPRRARKGARV